MRAPVRPAAFLSRRPSRVRIRIALSHCKQHHERTASRRGQPSAAPIVRMKQSHGGSRTRGPFPEDGGTPVDAFAAGTSVDVEDRNRQGSAAASTRALADSLRVLDVGRGRGIDANSRSKARRAISRSDGYPNLTSVTTLNRRVHSEPNGLSGACHDVSRTPSSANSSPRA